MVNTCAKIGPGDRGARDKKTFLTGPGVITTQGQDEIPPTAGRRVVQGWQDGAEAFKLSLPHTMIS